MTHDDGAACTRCEALALEIAALRKENETMRGKFSCAAEKRTAAGDAHEATARAASDSAVDSEQLQRDTERYSPLSRREMQRYSRQMLVPDFRAAKQLRLRDARVLIIGAGGLGCPAALYLGAVGVGVIGLVDNDCVERSNLHRQIGHDEHSIGELKVESLARRVRRLNPDIIMETHNTRLSIKNAAHLVFKYDVVVDASDNPATRYLVNDVCALQQKPLISGSALGLEGQVSVFTYAHDSPCYRCLYPNAPRQPQSCAENGVLGVVPGIIGCLQALETVKVLTDMGSSSVGSQLLFDAYDSQFRRIKLPHQRRSDCRSCGPTSSELRSPIDTSECVSLDESPHLGVENRVSVEKLSQIRCKDPSGTNSKWYTLLDTRATHQFEMVHFPEATNISFDQLRRAKAKGKLTELVQERLAPSGNEEHKIFVICRRGVDSVVVTSWLLGCGFKNVFNVDGGYTLYADERHGVDASFPMY